VKHAAAERIATVNSPDYAATAERDGGWWIVQVQVPDLRRTLTTQVRRLDQARPMAADLIATVTGESVAESAVSVVPVLDGPLRDKVARARAARAELERVQEIAFESTRSAARDLTAAGISNRDAGLLLGITHQRVQQLCSQATTGVRRAIGSSRKVIPSGS
jgi:hypothetical protein